MVKVGALPPFVQVPTVAVAVPAKFGITMVNVAPTAKASLELKV